MLMVYMDCQRARKQATYENIEGMAESLLAPSDMREEADMPIEYLWMKVVKL